jgi:hypothetical protein
MDHLAILSQTIADHARKVAHEEWKSEHGNVLEQILGNAGLKQLATHAPFYTLKSLHAFANRYRVLAQHFELRAAHFVGQP